MELDNNMNLMNMVKKNLRNIVSKIIPSIIVVTVSGYFLYPLTKQDKSQEIKSQGNSSIVNNIKDNNSVIHNHNNISINIPVLLVFHLGKNVYNDFESNACAALEIIHLSNNVLYIFAKTNPSTYEFLKNLNFEFFLKIKKHHLTQCSPPQVYSPVL